MLFAPVRESIEDMAEGTVTEDLRLARLGDQHAAGRFYDATCRDAWRLACWMAGDTRTAGQIVIQAYECALHAPADAPDAASPRAYLLSLIRASARGSG